MTMPDWSQWDSQKLLIEAEYKKKELKDFRRNVSSRVNINNVKITKSIIDRKSVV
jgi:hypothetical protein